MQSEFQAAYALSQQMFTGGNVVTPVDAFAVVQESPAYCQFTDAMLPTPCRQVVRVCGSRKVAEYYANKLANDPENYECNFVVYPKLPAPPQNRDFYEIPF